MKLTNYQWESIEKRLYPPFGRAKLKVDNYLIDLLIIKSKNRLKYEIMVYVNSQFKGCWMTDKTPEAEDIRKRFYRKNKRCFFRSTSKDLKKFGKRFIKEMKEKYTAIIYYPYWSSFSSLKKHLIANNKDFEIIDSEEVEVKR